MKYTTLIKIDDVGDVYVNSGWIEEFPGSDVAQVLATQADFPEDATRGVVTLIGMSDDAVVPEVGTLRVISLQPLRLVIDESFRSFEPTGDVLGEQDIEIVLPKPTAHPDPVWNIVVRRRGQYQTFFGDFFHSRGEAWRGITVFWDDIQKDDEVALVSSRHVPPDSGPFRVLSWQALTWDSVTMNVTVGFDQGPRVINLVYHIPPKKNE